MERKKSRVNNSFYDDLGHRWNGDSQHPIGLLVAENKVRTPWVIRTISQNFPSSCHILDIGCGGGLLANPLSEKGHHVTGVDLSRKSLQFALESDTTKRARYVEADAEYLPFTDEQFDVTCAMDLLEHVNNPEKVIQEAARVTRPGGLFFFHTFNRTPLSYLLIIKGVELFVKNTPPDMHVYSHFIKPTELTSYCTGAGFVIEEIKGFRPDLNRWSFWKTAFTRQVEENFSFQFCNSLSTGYVGVARKVR